MIETDSYGIEHVGTTQLVTGKQRFALSHAQERSLQTTMTGPAASSSSISCTIRFKGELDFECLENAICSCIHRHDALRLRISKAGEKFDQTVTPWHDRKLDFFDFSSPYGQDRFEKWLSERVNKSLPLFDTELFYFAMIKFSQDQFGFFMNLSRSIADDNSATMIVCDILKNFSSLKGGQSNSELPPPSYIEYVESEQEYLASEHLNEDKKFWEEKFRALPEETSLLFTKPKGTDGSAGSVIVPISSSLIEKAEAYAASRGVGVFHLVEAVLFAYIARTARCEEATIAIETSRQTVQPNESFGPCSNSVVVHTPVDTRTVFDEFLGSIVRETSHTIDERRAYPYDLLIQDLKNKFGTVPNLRNISLREHVLNYPAEAEVQFHRPDFSASPFELSIHLWRTSQRSDRDFIEFFYSKSAFKHEDVLQVGERILRMLEQAIEQPSKKLHELTLLSAEEKQKLLLEFNQTELPISKADTFIELFENQVKERPGNVALLFEDHRMTYGELNFRANQIARVLRARGAKPDSVVGILAEPSLEMIIGVLGILKSGAAYLPLDPKNGLERMIFALEDSGALLLLAQRTLIEDESKLPCGWMDLDSTELCSGEGANIPVTAGPSNLAYIIYTSGSTGKPKGVMIEHRALANMIAHTQRELDLKPSDRATKYAGFAFDASVIEIFPPLAMGAGLCVISKEIRLSAEKVNSFLEANHVTVAFFPTPFMEQFMELADNKSLRAAMTGGDKLSRFKRKNFRLLNLYGPTEYTVYTTAYAVESLLENIPIGKPVSHTQVYILDPHNNLQPVGAPGELCIAGAGMARGYLNRPELTAEKFTANPFQPGMRMYRTGDLARWLPDGNIEFLGRIDFQEKIRGFRIELGEIEFHLSQVKDITQCIVTARKDHGDEKYLCGYFVANRKIDDEELKRSLGKALPPYMVPQFFVQMEALPLTPNGKVDRKALPAPAVGAAAHKQDKGVEIGSVLPATIIEERLVEIWKELLSLSNVSVTDDFFALGGHSLKAALLQAKIAKVLGAAISFNDIFANPTVRGLADVISKARQESADAIRVVGPRTHYPLTVQQRQMYFMETVGVGTTFNLPMFFEIDGDLDQAKLGAALDALVERHEALRTYFQVIDGEPAQVVLPHANLKKLHREVKEEELAQIVADFISPFDLSKAPLCRAELLTVNPKRHILMMDFHHIVFDGSSVGIFVKELGALYTGQPLPALPIQYKDYAAWQADWVKTGGVNDKEDYWLQEYRTALTRLELPTDFERPSQLDPAGDRVSTLFNSEFTEKLLQFAAKTGTTLNMLLLAAYNTLLARYSNAEDIVVGTGTAGRHHPDTPGLVGMFVNMMPIRSFPTADKSFSQFLRETKEKLILGYDNQDYPADTLITKLRIKRNPSRSPLFDVTFVLQNMGLPSFSLPGLSIKPRVIKHKIAHSDLLLEIFEEDTGLVLNWEYRTSLFRHATIEKMAEHFKNVLETVIANPEQRIRDLPMLSENEEACLVNSSNKADPKVHQYIMDRNRKLLPIGIAGEICSNVEPGDGQTTDEFFMNPYRSGEKLFRTGRRGRLLPNGEIEQLGILQPPVPESETSGEQAVTFIDSRNEVEKKVLDAWKKVLKLDKIGVLDNFFDLGGHSLKAVALVAELQKSFELSINDVFEHQTIAELAGRIKPKVGNLKSKLAELKLSLTEEANRASTEVDSQRLDNSLSRYRERNRACADKDFTKVKPYKSLLLTGATGYLGAYLLKDLLEQKQCHVHLIVRAKDHGEAITRVKTKTAHYFGSEFFDKYRDRISVLSGDLAKTRLGLTDSDYQSLAQTMDCIVHSAANVKHFGRYEEFYEANVQATVNLTELAKTGKRKDMVHVSTGSVAMGNIEGVSERLFTEYDVNVGQREDNYYVRTKQEAELAIEQARKEGVNVHIFRAGNISFHSATGITQDNLEQNGFFQQVRAYLNLGLVPDDGEEVEFAFVDQMSKAMVLLFDREGLENENIHFWNSHPVKLADALLDPKLGLSLRKVSMGEFLDFLHDHYDNPSLRPHIESIMLHRGWMSEKPNSAETQQTRIAVVSEKSELLLKNVGFEWPRLDPSKLLPTIVEGLRDRIDFLKTVPLFSNLEDPEINRVARIVRRTFHNDGTDLLWEGDPNNSLYLIADGTVELSRHSVSGWLGTIGILGSKDYFGEETLIRESGAVVSAQAILGNVTLYAIESKDLAQMLIECPRLGIGFVKTLSERTLRLRAALANMN